MGSTPSTTSSEQIITQCPFPGKVGPEVATSDTPSLDHRAEGQANTTTEQAEEFEMPRRCFNIAYCNRRRPPTSSLRRRLELARAAEQQMRFHPQYRECTPTPPQFSQRDNRIALHMALNTAAIYQRQRLQCAATAEMSTLRRSVHSLHNRIDVAHSNEGYTKGLWRIIGQAYSPTRSTICA